MAIAIEFASVIVRKTAVEINFRGGIDAFVRQRLPNFSEDEHLLRVTFMSTREAEVLMAPLEDVDISPESDMALVTTDSCPAWLRTGPLEGEFACWLAEYPPGKLVKYDWGFLVRCPVPTCNSYSALAAIVSSCNATFSREPSPNYQQQWCLRCVRGNAKITIDVYGDLDADTFRVVGAIRDFTRRSFFAEDTAFIRDLESAIRKAGADDGPKKQSTSQP